MKRTKRDGRASKIPKNNYLICIWYVYWFPALGDVSGDPRSPGNANLVLLLHLLQRAPRTHVEQLRYKTSASKTKAILELFSWNKKKENKFERECSSFSPRLRVANGNALRSDFPIPFLFLSAPLSGIGTVQCSCLSAFPGSRSKFSFLQTILIIILRMKTRRLQN